MVGVVAEEKIVGVNVKLGGAVVAPEVRGGRSHRGRI